MTKICFPSHPSVAEFEGFINKWNKHRHVQVEFSNITLSKSDIIHIKKLCFKYVPEEFAFVVLENMAERSETSDAVLVEIFNRGDKSCKVAICLRQFLSSKLRKMCSNCTDPDIVEHFAMQKWPN